MSTEPAASAGPAPMEDTEPAAPPAATVTEPATTAEAEAPAPVAAPAKKRRVKQQTIGPGAPTADAPPPRFCPPTEPSRARRLEDGLGDDDAALATNRWKKTKIRRPQNAPLRRSLPRSDSAATLEVLEDRSGGAATVDAVLRPLARETRPF
jgi:hypothetical protein